MDATQIQTKQLTKAKTGISGLDEITHGGLAAGRPTLVCGGPGSGKTLLGIAFLVKGATEFGEPGVLMSFEENAEELAQDVASLDYDLARLVNERKLVVDYVHIDRAEIEETGEFDLDGLFVRLEHAVNSIGARRVVLDTLESLFSGFEDEAILRAELRRLFRWLRDRNLTAVITGEKGENTLTRYGLEEYVTDAVIQLDHRVEDQISTRRLRVVKYRGSLHGTNEYPFLIDQGGLSVLPITSLTLQHPASSERVSSGLRRLDEMLDGRGYYRGSTILLSGTAGTGKTTIAASFIDAACRRGERAVHFLFEESPAQMLRNMRSCGIDLAPWVEQGLLRFHADRPSRFGLETHLLMMHHDVEEIRPTIVVVDPITNLMSVGTRLDVRGMLTRTIDYLKLQNITALFTSLTSTHGPDVSDPLISSLMDTWVLTSLEEAERRRRRWIYVLKARGISHSDEVREFRIGNSGVDILPGVSSTEAATW